jgi:hypothetical protein
VGVSQASQQNNGQGEPAEDRREQRRRFIADLLSLDVITAKGNVTAIIDLRDTFLSQDVKKEFDILARTVIQFGGDQLTIIPTDTDKPEGNVKASFNHEIWELHMDNVSKALERRKDDLEAVQTVIESIGTFIHNMDQDQSVISKLLDWLRPPKPPKKNNE